MLNEFNQVWDAPNVFVTDGACMTSAACQNPSLTYMAITARAAHSFITLPATVQDILLHLDLPHRPPRVSPARGPPQAEFDLDQSPAFDLAAPEPIPEHEFDQSPPHDWDT